MSLAHPQEPIAVDLDGTLLATDTLYEMLVHNAFRDPVRTLAAFRALTRGRAAFKDALSAVGHPDYSAMPRRETLVAYLEAQAARGREIHIVTAAHQSVAEAVARDHGFVCSAKGSCAGHNLKGPRKAEYLSESFPEGFVYAGDSAADVAVWKKAAGAIPVAVSRRTARALGALGTPIEADFPQRQPEGGPRALASALRLHQWAKNVLLAVPLFLAHAYTDLAAIAAVLIGIVLMGLVASGTYVLNDISDLDADRRHPTKRYRALASGLVSVRAGVFVAAVLIGTGVLGAFALSLPFALLLLCYLALTLAYSLRLKRLVLVDVFTLGALYTLRLLMGVALIGVALSPWLFAFSFLLFYSMSLAKRHVELVRSLHAPNDNVPGRGYRASDWPVTLALGIGAAVGAVIVIVLYLTEAAFPSGAYAAPAWLWASPLLIVLWVQRIWILAHRGELDDDPVAFALRDPASLLLGVLLALAFIAATVL